MSESLSKHLSSTEEARRVDRWRCEMINSVFLCVKKSIFSRKNLRTLEKFEAHTVELCVCRKLKRADEKFFVPVIV